MVIVAPAGQISNLAERNLLRGLSMAALRSKRGPHMDLDVIPEQGLKDRKSNVEGSRPTSRYF